MNARFVHPDLPHIITRNWFEIVDDVVRMELSQGEYAIFDLADLPLLAQHRWCAATFRWRTYAITQIRNARGRQVSVRMHRLIRGVTNASVFVDHDNMNGLDNRRVNIRVATRPQNAWNCPRPRTNTTGYKGVKRDRTSGRYSAAIRVCGKTIYLGGYSEAVEAARAYDEAARRYHGTFARTNF